MRVEETGAGQTTKTGPRDECVHVRERMSTHGLFPALALAPETAKLPVEDFKSFPLGFELVLVAFDGLTSESRVQRLEDHRPSVEQ